MNLKKIRLERNLSQSQLAELSGVSVRTIQEYEQGRKDINKASAETINKLASALNCTMEDLTVTKYNCFITLHQALLSSSFIHRDVENLYLDDGANKWHIGNLIDAANPDEEKLDGINEYYCVGHDGSVGLTKDNGYNVDWIYRRVKEEEKEIEEPVIEYGVYLDGKSLLKWYRSKNALIRCIMNDARVNKDVVIVKKVNGKKQREWDVFTFIRAVDSQKFNIE